MKDKQDEKIMDVKIKSGIYKLRVFANDFVIFLRDPQKWFDKPLFLPYWNVGHINCKKMC